MTLVGTNPGIGHNVDAGPSLTPEQEEILAQGRKRLADVTKQEKAFVARRTYDHWKPVARALQVLRDVAKAAEISFTDLREQYGFDSLKKDRISRLVKIADKEVEVEAWRATLTEEQRRDWSSAEAINRHCPALRKDGAPPPKRTTLAAALEEIKRLKAEIKHLNAHVAELEAARENIGAAS
jgi:DNA repair exonuclease SbcCD ATPase subunit